MLRFTFSTILFALIAIQLAGQKTFQNVESETPKYQASEILHSVFLIGDAGEFPEENSELRSNLSRMLAEYPESGAIFLGDNIYPRGLHKKSSEHRADDLKKLHAQLDIVKNHPGLRVFIPGNHDWKQGKDGGHKYVKRQDKYVQKYLDDEDAFLPHNGCPGPEIIEASEDLAIIVIDTQWWLHKFEKPSGEKDDCLCQDEEQFMLMFKDALRKYRRRNVLVVGHHPLYSNGEHGGKFTLKDHLFPLSAANEKLMVPLPVIGSIYPLYRSILGDRQDIQHPTYRNMRNQIVYAISQYDNVIYAAGHEHNLQYRAFNGSHHIVSGSGCKSTHLAKNKQVDFASEHRGFAKVDYLTNGEAHLQFISEKGETIFSKKLYQKTVKHAEVRDVPKVSYKGKTETVTPEPAYQASGFSRFFFGDLNRDLWTTPFEVSYLDIHFEKGGLTPLKQGGGMQSISLRMKGQDGKQYVIRKIQKDASLLVDKNLQGTAAKSVVYDEIAGSHPYASIVVPKIAESVGIYSTNPKLVFVPNDPVLGDFQEIFGGAFCLFEERPAGDMSAYPLTGGSEKVVSYAKTVDKTHGKYSHNVDQRFVLKSRLTDILIGDWDRHDDQWRWATFKGENKTVYRPIPRDRDQAFFQFDGLIPSIANRKWLLRKFQNWDVKTRDIAGLCFNARYFDRAFLTSLDQSEWMSVANEIKEELTDEEIDEAIALFPKEAQEYNGEFIRNTLKNRRDNMSSFAKDYYNILARKVDVVGKLKDDYFEVIRREDGKVEVNIYPLKKGEKKVDERYYHRVFDKKETKEIRLYGLDGEDTYDISGEVKKSIKIRVIAGFDDDEFIDNSKVSGLSKKTLIYDTQDGREKEDVKKQLGSESLIFIKKDKNGLVYNRREFKYDAIMPLPYVGANPDDGLFLGAKATHTHHGFKKTPYALKHSFGANVALKTNAYNGFWNLDAKQVISALDAGFDLQFNKPFVFRFNGVGNEAGISNDEEDEQRIRYVRVHFDPYLGLSSKSGASTLRFGAAIRHVDFNAEESDDNLAQPSLKETFYGGTLNYMYENVDSKIEPWRGIRFNLGGMSQKSISDSISYVDMNASLSLYFPVQWFPLRTTLALRTAIGTNEGDFYFFQSQFIGGQKELRGVARNRFSGHSAFYNNAELRIAFRKAERKVKFANFGMLAHFDYGRVWADEEDSNVWHQSYGGGLYMNLLDAMAISVTQSWSDTDSALLFGTSFLF